MGRALVAGDLALINPAHYAVGMRQSLTVESSIHYRFRNDITAYRFFARAGPAPDPAAGWPPAAPGARVTVLERGPEVAGLLWREPAAPGLATARDLAYLRWRYGAAPLLGYRAVTEERDGRLAGLAIFRVRPRGGLWETTVAEVLAGGDVGTARRLLRRVVGAAPADHLTFAAPAGSAAARAATRGGFLPSPAGIALVANPLVADLTPDPSELGSWSLSLGDLEVF